MNKMLEFVRTTIVGGALFLLPIFLIVFVVSKIVGLMSGLTDPLVQSLGVTSVAGIAVGHIATVLGIVLGAFVVGLLARTRAGRGFFSWLQDGVAKAIPQFGLLQDMAKTLASEEAADIPVVLVPTDAGWAFGLLVEPPQGDWHTIYLPGSPQMSSGSVAYAHIDQVHRTDLTLNQLWVILRGRGRGSGVVYAQLAAMHAAEESRAA